jgi:hypothetical protein
MIIDISTHKFFDDITNFIISTVSITMTQEIYTAGTVSVYGANHCIGVTCKQNGLVINIYPYNILNAFFINSTWPSSFELTISQGEKPSPDAKMNLDVYERPVRAFSASMFINYYENQHDKVVQRYGDKRDRWPEDWRFARVLRGSFAHGGSLSMPENDRSVTWQTLTYSPRRDNGKKPYPTKDLWPGDLIYLLMDLDKHIP